MIFSFSHSATLETHLAADAAIHSRPNRKTHCPATINMAKEKRTVKQDFSSIIQIGVIVSDAAATAANLKRLLGWDASNIWETARVSGRTYHNEPADFACRMIFYQLPGIELEIIQPLLAPSCWQDYLDACGNGIHHLQFDVANSAQSLSALRQSNIEIEQQGRALPFGEQVFWAYMDSQPQLGFTMELTNRREFPKQLPQAATVTGDYVALTGVSVVVNNLEQTMRQWERILGWQPAGQPYRIYGEPYQNADSGSLSGAVSYLLPNLEIELVRPVFGASCRREYLASRGDGLFSLNISLRTHADLLPLTQSGLRILEQGHTLCQNQLMRWTTLESLSQFGFYLNVIYP